jgi:hypothetical protein
LVTRQGGKIWIQSQLGVGSTFSFTLPVFSLNNVLSPLIRNGRWPTESVALVMVKTCLLDGWPSRESQQAWSNEVRTLVQRCLLPDLDVLLPKMSSAVEGERFFVAAFADDKGASVLVKRIREQFERRPDLHQTNLSISYTLLKSFRPDVGESMDNIVTSLAAMLEEAIKFQIRPEAIE